MRHALGHNIVGVIAYTLDMNWRYKEVKLVCWGIPYCYLNLVRDFLSISTRHALVGLTCYTIEVKE